MRHGFGMIEMVIALSILTTALIAAVSLSTLTIMTGKQAELRLIAVNLAREGIEVVRNIRDSNRLGNVVDPLRTNLTSGMDYTAVPLFSSGIWSLDFTPTVITDPATQVYNASGVLIPFRRLLTLDEICKDGTMLGSGSSCVVGNPKIGIRVTSRVQYTATGSVVGVSVIEDRLYAWQ